MGTDQPSSWICEVLTALEKDDPDDDPSQILIWKVPVRFRTNAEHYEPLNWRFGLHHCPQILHINETEGFKIKVARALQLTGERWDAFCKHVVQEPKSFWEAVYGQSPHASSYTIEEIRCRLSLDALFLVVYMHLRGAGIESLSPALQKVMENPILEIYSDALWQDILLIENQIPMELLKRVVGILRTDYQDVADHMAPWEHAQWQGWNIGNCVWWDNFHDPQIEDFERHVLFKKRMEKRLQHADSYYGLHILDSVYRILCGKESLETPHDKDFQIAATATYMEACGVKIKGKEFTCFEDISFENGCLSLPFLRVGDNSETYFRNLVMHEVVARPGGRTQYAVKCYLRFMGDLMQTPEDVNLLVKRGVLQMGVSSPENVIMMWKNVKYNIVIPQVTDEFFTMLTNVKKYTKQRRNKILFEFKKQFCSRPWIVVSVLAVTFVTLATGIQTYVAIIGSNRMKPHFPP